MEKCPGVLTASKETVVLAIELTEKSILNSPDMIWKVIQDPKVQEAMKKTLLAEAKRLQKLQKQGKPVGVSESKTFAKTVGLSFAEAGGSALKHQVENSAEYQKVKQSAPQLQCSFNESPVGVFVDKNKGLIYVVAAGLALGAATAMYVARKGDPIANAATKLIGKKIRFKVMGKMEVGTRELKFTPSTREVGVTAFTEIKWEHIKVDVNMKVSTKEDKLETAVMGAEIVANVSKKLTLKALGAVGTQASKETSSQALTYKAQLAAIYKVTESGISIQTLAYINQTPEQRKFGGSGNIGYGIGGKTAPGGKFTFSGSGSHTRQLKGPATPKTEYKMTIGWEMKF